jgi:hypothetical protein
MPGMYSQVAMSRKGWKIPLDPWCRCVKPLRAEQLLQLQQQEGVVVPRAIRGTAAGSAGILQQCSARQQLQPGSLYSSGASTGMYIYSRIQSRSGVGTQAAR